MTVEVRRNTTLAAGLGLGAAVVAILWLARAGSDGGAVDWLVCLVTGTIAVTQLVGLVDARLPLLTADEQGVRIRLRHEWLGLPWSTLEQVVVEQRDALVADGRLVLVPRNPGSALEALLPSSRRAVDWQRRLHGAPHAVPLSVGTRWSSADLAADLRALADGRADVVAVHGRERARLREIEEVAHRSGAGLGRLVSRLARSRDLDSDPVDAPAVEVAAPPVPGPRDVAPVSSVPPVSPARAARRAVRVELSRETRPRVPVAEPVSGVVAGAVVFDDVPPTAVADPVIGPQVRAARERTGLDVEELSARTRIRPHVIEAVEVDDFGPCGGDFYARGHLRTLARYLGLDADALVATYDERYAHAPINARRVFEAELAGGLSGGMRATTGGPRWSLLVAAVLVLAMVWGVARFFTEPAPELAAQSPHVGEAGLAANRQPITSPLTTTSTLTVLSLGGPSRVTVRDRTGDVVWSGRLHRGERHQVAGVKPFRVRTDHGAATRLRLGDHWLGPVGADDAPAHRTVR
jgi:hypothetical protein